MRLRLPLGYVPEAPFAKRQKAVQKLGKLLTRGEVNTIYRFLDSKSGDQELPLLQFNALKNDLANVLVNQHDTPPDFGRHLMGMFSDKTHDVVWRDYCIQFLGQWYRHADADADEKARIREVLCQAVDEKGNTIAGTALLALIRNGCDAEMGRTEIGRLALVVAEDSSANSAAKTTALQVCAEMGVAAVLPVARQIVENTGEDVCLRMSALAVFGRLGGERDVALVTGFSKSSDVRIRRAATAALRRLQDGDR